MLPRSEQAIYARVLEIHAAQAADPMLSHDFMFGRRSTLLEYLPWPKVQEFYRLSGMSEYREGMVLWTQADPDLDAVRLEIAACLPSALAGAYSHSGLMAIRAVERMTEQAWLMGWEQVVAYAGDRRNFTQFGMPVAYAMMAALGMSPRGMEGPGPVTDESWFVRMRQGYPCTVGCHQGCATVGVYPAAIDAVFNAAGELVEGHGP